MTPQQIKKKVLAYGDWEWWAERTHGPFILSLYALGQTREYMKRAGADVLWPATLYQNGAYYKSNKSWDVFVKRLQPHLNNGKLVFRVTALCERYGVASKKKIIKLLASRAGAREKFETLYNILGGNMPYVWFAHGLEHVYRQKLYAAAGKLIKQDLDKFIGDISYPIKKNVHYFLEQGLRGRTDLKILQEKFGWMKARDGFSEAYSIRELQQARNRIRSAEHKKFQRVKVPKELIKLVKITQELVYLRTLRTDILYNLMFTARPVLKEIAKYYQIPFHDLANYSATSLVEGKPRKYPSDYTFLSCDENFAFFDHPVLHDSVKAMNSISGMIAFKGVVRGRVRIVKTAYEIKKVKKGDVLFAPTTSPSYVIGMRLAAAFVTDEGGITSHTAIVAREMHKPAIIGTKIGTKIFKDGDMVEVDANKGIVRKI